MKYTIIIFVEGEYLDIFRAKRSPTEEEILHILEENTDFELTDECEPKYAFYPGQGIKILELVDSNHNDWIVHVQDNQFIKAV